GHHQRLAASRLLELGVLEDSVDRLLLVFRDESAGVDQHHLGLLRLLDDAVAALEERAQHHLGVHPVLRAAEREQVESRVVGQAGCAQRFGHLVFRRGGACNTGSRHSRKFSKPMSTSSCSELPRTSCIAACRSSLLLPETRTASPWMAPCTLSFESLISLTIAFAFSTSSPCWKVSVWSCSFPDCSTFPYFTERKEMPRLAIFCTSTSRAASSRCSVEERSLMPFSFSVCTRSSAVSVPLKS